MNNITFFVSGNKSSGVGIRGTHFCDGLRSEYNTSIFYRKRGILNFLKEFKKIRKTNPTSFYLLDIGYRGLITHLLLRLLGGRHKLIVDTGDIPYQILKLQKSPIYNIIMMYLTEKILFFLSSAIVVRGKYHKKLLEKYKKTTLIPDGVIVKDFENPDIKSVSKLNRELNPKNYLTIGILGSINFIKGIDGCYGKETVEIMKELKGLQVVAIIIGGGDGLPYLKKMAKKLGVSDKIKFLGELKYEDLPEYFNTIDICLLPLVEHISMKVRTTGKLPLYLASNRYIISTQTGDAKHYLKENGEIINYSGIKDSSWSKKVASRIKVIYNNKSILEKSKIGSKISKKNFDYAILLRRLKKII